MEGISRPVGIGACLRMSCVTYILRCADGTLYTGWTNDPEKRLKAHNSGRGAKYTKTRRPVEYAYLEYCADRGQAMSREAAIKQLSRAEKLKLIESGGGVMEVMSLSAAERRKVSEVLKLLHEHPERSGEERETKAIIRRFFAEHTTMQCVDHAGGLCAVHAPEGDPAQTIAFRADFDAVALPDGGAAHLCGHDGHTAALLGLALLLERFRVQRRVLLLFQPAEENGAGALTMLPLLKEQNVSEIYGCHNLPGFPFGRVFTTAGTFSCASSGLTIRFAGKPAHAAYPERGISPSPAVAELLKEVQRINEEQSLGALTFATVIGCAMGQKAFGTSAEKAEVWLTLRSDTNDRFELLKNCILGCAGEAAARYGLRLETEVQDVFPAVENAPDRAEHVFRRTGALPLDGPMRWSEDFGHYLKDVRGAFFGIGAGDVCPLHTEHYCYPEALAEVQCCTFFSLV